MLSIASKMVSVESVACDESEGKTFIGRDPQAQNYLCRVNKVDALFCSIIDQIRTEALKMNNYDCEVVTTEPDPAPAATPAPCPLECVITEDPEVYEINVNDLSEEMYDLLALLETETCETLKMIQDFAAINEPCPEE